MMTWGWPSQCLWHGQSFLMLLHGWKLMQHIVMYFQACSNSAYPMHSGERYKNTWAIQNHWSSGLNLYFIYVPQFLWALNLYHSVSQEIQSVFAAYGIEVDYRHLSLLSDYMTFEGTYKPLNRISMESNPSPLQKMSFETTVHFLVNSSINAGIDNLSSPSAQIVLGKVVSSGTGSHELMNPLITL